MFHRLEIDSMVLRECKHNQLLYMQSLNSSFVHLFIVSWKEKFAERRYLENRVDSLRGTQTHTKRYNIESSVSVLWFRVIVTRHLNIK